MENEFTSEMFAKTLNQIGIYLSMIDQMMFQQIYIEPECPYFDHVAHKLMDVHTALIAMNTIYADRYEQYKEQYPNG